MRSSAREKSGCQRQGHAIKIVETLRRICGDCEAAGIVIPGTRQSGGRLTERRDKVSGKARIGRAYVLSYAGCVTR